MQNKQDYLQTQRKLKHISVAGKREKVLNPDKMIEQLVSDKDTFKAAELSVQSRLTYPIPEWLKVNSGCTPPIYDQIWNCVRESTTSPYCNIRVVSHLFNTSHLSIETLGYLWCVGNLRSPTCLTQQELYIMLALIALMQNNYMVNDISLLKELDAPIIPQLDYTMLRTPYIKPRENFEASIIPKNFGSNGNNGFSTGCESLTLNFFGITDTRISSCRPPKVVLSSSSSSSSSSLSSPSLSQQQLMQQPKQLEHQQQQFTSNPLHYQQHQQQSEASGTDVNTKLAKLNARHRRVRQIVNKIRYKLPPIVEANIVGNNGSSASFEYSSADDAAAVDGNNRPALTNGSVNSTIGTVPTSSFGNPSDFYSVSFAGPSKYVPPSNTVNDFQFSVVDHSNRFNNHAYVRNTNNILQSSTTASMIIEEGELDDDNNSLSSLAADDFDKSTKIGNVIEADEDDDEFTEFQSAVTVTVPDEDDDDDEYTDFQSAVPLEKMENNPSSATTDHIIASLPIIDHDDCIVGTKSFEDNVDDDASSKSSVITTDALKFAFQQDNIASFMSVFDNQQNRTSDLSKKDDTAASTELNSAVVTSIRVEDCCLNDKLLLEVDLLTDIWKSVSSNVVNVEHDDDKVNKKAFPLTIDDEQNLEYGLSSALDIAEGIYSDAASSSSLADEQDIKSLQLDPISDVCLATSEDKYEALRMLESENMVSEDCDAASGNNDIKENTTTDLDDDDDDFGDFVAAAVNVADEEEEEEEAPTITLKDDGKTTLQAKCLDACVKLLEEAVTVFQDVERKFEEDENTSKSVFKDSRCCRYLNQLKIVYETSQKLCTYFGTPDISAKLNEAWSSVSKYVQYDASANEQQTIGAVDGSTEEVCNICQTECSGNIAHIGTIAYHPSCINLFLHFVENSNIADALEKQAKP